MKVDLILTADWHLREDTPVCRTDNFWNAQWQKVDQIHSLQEKYDCPVLHAGDLYHHWKPSPLLLSMTAIHLPDKFYTVVGNHDLPQHNLDLIEKTGVYNLVVGGELKWFQKAGNFGQAPGKAFVINDTRVAVWHQFVWDGKKLPWPGCDEMTAEQVLKKYPQFDLIVTGDHHKPFIYEYKGRLLVNCGCLTRQTSDYANHKPCVWLWSEKTNTAKPYYLSIEDNVVTREHLEEKENREFRLNAFIERLSDNWEVGLTFEDNLTRFIDSNRLRKSVVDLIYKSLE